MPVMTWKHLWSWLFMLIVSVQWIGGVIYVKLSHSALIEQDMDDAEVSLADHLAQEYGIESTIKILDEADQEALLSAGYGTPFIFSLSDGDSRDYFTLEQNTVELIHAEYLINGPEQQRDASKALLSLNKLFSPCIINRAKWPVTISRRESGNFAYNPMRDLYFRTIPTPPPTYPA